MISIIIPVYNSEKSIKELCKRIIKTMESHELKYEIILVDDYSNDNSYRIMEELYNENKNIVCIKLIKNYGQQNALLCGLRHGKGDYYVTIDDDLQNIPEDIIKLLDKIKQGYDVVYGVCYNKNYNSYRNLGTKLKEYIFTIFLGKPNNIKLTSFRVMNKHIVKKVNKETVSHIYLSATILKHTKNIGNINISYYSRMYGKSNYDFKKLYKLFLGILRYYTNIPIVSYYKKNIPQYRIEKVLRKE
ncbi:MAG: glycosyltransferase family 2 protein [Vallitalea sp.]|jgi:undecaprenyl-phosphate 4-deoxy-4-formamido-L-arabinose transferase|nr:glycosyltransferase family 2 protein [Vallitalea sp.]